MYVVKSMTEIVRPFDERVIVGLPVSIGPPCLVMFRVFAGIHIRLRLVDEHIVDDDLRLCRPCAAADFRLTPLLRLQPGFGCLPQSGSPDHRGTQNNRHASIHNTFPFGERSESGLLKAFL